MMLEAAGKDLTECKAMLVLAEQTNDLELQAAAVSRYKALCETLHTFGFTIGMVVTA